MPTCAACAESRVPWPPPPSAQAMERWCSPATSSHDRRALQARCSPSPCTRLSRARTTTRAPPPTRAISGRCALPAPRRARRRHRSGSHVHCRSLVRVGAQLFPCGPVATLTRTMRRDSFPAHQSAGRDGPPCSGDSLHRLTRPVSIGFEPSSTLKGVLPLVHLRYAFRSCLPRPRGPIVPARRVVVRTACRPRPQLRGQTVLSFTGLPRQPGGRVLHPARTGSASWRTWTTWNGSRQISAFGHRSATGMAIQSAMSQDTS